MCSALAALGEQAADLGRDLHCCLRCSGSTVDIDALVNGLAAAGNGICLALKAFHLRGRLGALPSADLASALLWPAAALTCISERSLETTRELCAMRDAGLSRGGRQLVQQIVVACGGLRQLLEAELLQIASVASRLLGLRGEGIGELQGRPAELLAAAIGPAVQRQVR